MEAAAGLTGQRQVRGPVCPSRMVWYPEEFNYFKQSTSFLWPLRFVRVFREIRGENAIVFFTTEYTEKSNGRAYHEAGASSTTWRCPVNTSKCSISKYSGRKFRSVRHFASRQASPNLGDFSQRSRNPFKTTKTVLPSWPSTPIHNGRLKNVEITSTAITVNAKIMFWRTRRRAT